MTIWAHLINLTVTMYDNNGKWRLNNGLPELCLWIPSHLAVNHGQIGGLYLAS